MPRIASRDAVDWKHHVLIEVYTKDALLFYRVSKGCARQSKLFSVLLDADKLNTREIAVPVRNTTLMIVELIIQYMEFHEYAPPIPMDKPFTGNLENLIDSWDYTFLKKHLLPDATKGMELLLEMIKSANYFGIDTLVDLSCAAVASHMKGKSTEELRSMFHLADDLTPDEKKRFREEEIIARMK